MVVLAVGREVLRIVPVEWSVVQLQNERMSWEKHWSVEKWVCPVLVLRGGLKEMGCAM